MTTAPELVTDPSDGLPALGIGEWAKEKHAILAKYIEASTPARKKAYSESTYIDLYCGPGRAFVKGAAVIEDGSPLVAAKAAASRGLPFSHFFINDECEEFANACGSRLGQIGVTPRVSVGKAEETIDTIIQAVPRRGITIAFIDPFNLMAFSILEKLATLSRIDVVMHISVQDLNRNVFRYVKEKSPILEAFAPGANDSIKPTTKQEVFQNVSQYWRNLVESTGLRIGERFKTIRGPKNAPLYWLAIAAMNPLADKIWSSIVKADTQRSLF